MSVPQPPPGHLEDDEPDEDLFEDASTKALSSNGGSVDGRMRDFDDDDEGDFFREPRRFGTPVDGREPAFLPLDSSGSSPRPPHLVPGSTTTTTAQRFNKMPGLSGYNSEVEDVDEGEVVEVKLSDEERGRSGE